MATRAERFKADSQRAAQAKNRPAASGGAVRSVKNGEPRTASGPNTATHNFAAGAAKRKNSTYEFEEVSETSRPSRKSTRRSPNHIKPDSPLRIKTMSKTMSPGARATRSA